MPTSSKYGKAYTAYALGLLDKHFPIVRALDIGAGEGCYPALLKSALPDCEWDAIEAWGPYVNEYKLDRLYSKVIIGDARYVNYHKLGRYDIAICGDMLNQMQAKDAVELVSDLTLSCRLVIFTMPVCYSEQGALDGNPFQTVVEGNWTSERIRASFSHLAGLTVDFYIGVGFATRCRYTENLVKTAIASIERAGPELIGYVADIPEFDNWRTNTEFEAGLRKVAMLAREGTERIPLPKPSEAVAPLRQVSLVMEETKRYRDKGETIALFCKSFINDFYVFQRMYASLKKHNIEKIPFILSVPTSDLGKFQSEFGGEFTIVTDEELCGLPYPSGWIFQQAVKLNVNKLNVADNYFIIDSDFIFFRDFVRSDFISGGLGKFIITRHNYVFLPHKPLLIEPLQGYRQTILNALEIGEGTVPQKVDTNKELPLTEGTVPLSINIQELFQRKGEHFGYQPAPILCSSVLTALQKLASSLEERELSLVKYVPWEYSWYGEMAIALNEHKKRELANPSIFYITSDEAFRCVQNLRLDINTVRKNFMGVSLASRHLQANADLELDFALESLFCGGR